MIVQGRFSTHLSCDGRSAGCMQTMRLPPTTIRGIRAVGIVKGWRFGSSSGIDDMCWCPVCIRAALEEVTE